MVVVAALMVCCGHVFCSDEQARRGIVPGDTLPVTLFTDVDDAFSTLLNEKSELRWEASTYITEHPVGVVDRLKHLIEMKDPSWDLAMYTLTGIGGNAVVRFYCDLLDRNRHEMDESKAYPSGSGCDLVPPENFFGESILRQLGQLGDKSADPCLQRAWLDNDNDVKALVPRARYDIGTLALEDLKRLTISDTTHRDIFLQTLNEIGYDKIHANTDAAIEIFSLLCTMPEAGNSIRSSAHISLVQCYELKKDYDRALNHCDWVIKYSEVKEFPPRNKVHRLVLLFLQGKMALNELFEMAKKEDGLYDEIAQLGRCNDLGILERIVNEAPPNSEYPMEAHYWKLEYFDSFGMSEQARAEFEFIIQNCKHEYILEWAQSAMAKSQEIAERTARNNR